MGEVGRNQPGRCEGSGVSFSFARTDRPTHAYLRGKSNGWSTYYYGVLGRSPCTMHTHAPDGMIMIGVFSIAGFLTTSNPRYFVSPLKGTNHLFWFFGDKGLQLASPSVQKKKISPIPLSEATGTGWIQSSPTFPTVSVLLSSFPLLARLDSTRQP